MKTNDIVKLIAASTCAAIVLLGGWTLYVDHEREGDIRAAKVAAEIITKAPAQMLAGFPGTGQ